MNCLKAIALTLIFASATASRAAEEWLVFEVIDGPAKRPI